MKLFKSIKKVACVLAAVSVVCASSMMLTSCDTDWPKATMTLEFQGKTYKLEYRLYRKFFPKTVQHFIELANAGYYDGLCVHSYEDGNMYTGNYVYDTDSSYNLKERNYFEYLKEHNVTLTETVYTYVSDGTDPTKAGATALHTLVGEFEANNYSIENNDKRYGSETIGGLVMYYNDTSSVKSMPMATVLRNNARDDFSGANSSANWYDARSYSKNCATSQFYITKTSSSTVNKNYCVFAELYDEDSEDTYNSLTSAISTYISDQNYESTSDFVDEAAMDTFIGDHYLNDYNLTETYSVPKEPIYVKSVKINRT